MKNVIQDRLEFADWLQTHPHPGDKARWVVNYLMKGKEDNNENKEQDDLVDSNQEPVFDTTSFGKTISTEGFKT